MAAKKSAPAKKPTAAAETAVAVAEEAAAAAAAEAAAQDTAAAAEAAAKAEVEAKANADAEAASAEAAATAAAEAEPEQAAPGDDEPQLVVIGPVAVLPLVTGGERYVYRGAPAGDEYTEEGIKHAQAVGLVSTPE